MIPPAPFTCFSALYILVSFVIDKLTKSMWFYFWVLYSVPFICMCIFVLYGFDYCSFLLNLKSRSVRSLALFFYLKIVLAVWGLLCFCMDFEIIYFSSVKNVMGILIVQFSCSVMSDSL